MVQWLLPSTQVCSLNPVIGKCVIKHIFTVNCIENSEKTKMKKKDAVNDHIGNQEGCK